MKKQPLVNEEIEDMYREDGMVYCCRCHTTDDLVVDEDGNDICTDCLFEAQSELL